MAAAVRPPAPLLLSSFMFPLPPSPSLTSSWTFPSAPTLHAAVSPAVSPAGQKDELLLALVRDVGKEVGLLHVASEYPSCGNCVATFDKLGDSTLGAPHPIRTRP